MSFEKRHLVGIAIIFLASLVLIEWIQGDFEEPLSFDSTGLTRVVSDFGIVITITFLATQLYTHLLWRFDPLCKIPILKKEYIGTVAYVYAGKAFSNEIKIKVKQSMDKVELDMSTPLMRSRTLNGCFVEDRGMPVLYYVFNIEPRTVNPYPNERRTGAARLLPNENNELEGYYWTDQGNQGRLYFYATGNLPANTKNASNLNQNLCNAASVSSIKDASSCNNTNVVTVTVGSGDSVKNTTNATTQQLLSCLVEISNQRDVSFSGLGIVICDDSFDQVNLVPMRPNYHIEKDINIYSDEGKEFLLRIANANNDLHDGFFVANEKGNIIKIAQYLFPPLSSKKPDSSRGTRSYSALCGTMLKGIISIGIVSEDGTIAMYKDGACVYDSKKSES